MKNKMNFLRILFPIAFFGVSYVGYVMYTVTKGRVTGRVYTIEKGEVVARLHTPTPLMNLIMLAIICISLWLAYNFYKENEGE